MKITIKEYRLNGERRYLGEVKMGQHTYSTNDGSLNRLFKNMPITQRTYNCDCGNSLDRDINSARNILAQGLGIAESENIVSSSSVKQEAISSTPEVLGYE